MPSPINATAISSSLAVTLQRQLAARGVYWPGGRRLRLVETERRA